MPTNKSDYPQPRAHFDKTRWSVQISHPADADGLKLLFRVFSILFQETGHRNSQETSTLHKKYAVYQGSAGSVLVYYLPAQDSQPLLRIIFKPSSQQFRSTVRTLRLYLRRQGLQIRISKDGKSLSVNQKPTPVQYSDTENSGSDAPLKRLMAKLRLKKASDLLALDMIAKLDKVMGRLRFQKTLSGDVKGNKHALYELFMRLRSDSFDLSIRHSPQKAYMPYASIQVDRFQGDNGENPYRLLLFVLRCLKLYSDEVKPSEIELAFDFPGSERSVLQDLLSSVLVKKATVGWCIKRGSPLRSYEERCIQEELEKATHYIGHRDDKDYQIAIYGKPGKTRFEIRLKREGQRRLGVDSLVELFTMPWAVKFLDKRRVIIASAGEKAFQDADPSVREFATKSLITLVARIPPEKRKNLSRDYLLPNNKLRQVLETAASDFHEDLRNILENSGIILVPFGIEVPELCESTDIAENRLIGPHLDHIFRDLPMGVTSDSITLKDAICFSLKDVKGKLLVKIWIGRLTRELLDVKDRWILERFDDLLKP
ncbi:MAG: hypothetical protein ACLQPD_16395 [Desulfomonilaceae bacterium]